MARLEIKTKGDPDGPTRYAFSNTNGHVLRIVFAIPPGVSHTFPDAEIEIDDLAGVLTLRSCGSCMMPAERADMHKPGDTPKDTLAVFPLEIRLAIR